MGVKTAFLAGCLVVCTGSVCLASEAVSIPVQNSTDYQLTSASIDHQQLRPWLSQIKPAAGVQRTSSKLVRKEYWEQTVNRPRRHNLAQ